MHSYRVERADEASVRVNQRIANAHIDSEHYIRWVRPREMQLDTVNGPAFANTTVTKGFLTFADGKTEQAFWEVERPEQWLGGRIETTLYYSGDASTGNYRVRVVGTRSKVGSNHADVADFNRVNTVPAPPASGEVASFLLSQDYLEINPEWLWVDFSIARIGGVAGDDVPEGAEFYLHYVRHRYIPKRHEA